MTTSPSRNAKPSPETSVVESLGDNRPGPAYGAALEGLSPEIELLLESARSISDPYAVERIKALLEKEIDWAFLQEKADQHGILPLVYRSLNSAGWAGVPDDVRNNIRNSFQYLVWHNLLLTRELIRLLHLLEGEGIQALPFKGPVLAASIYGDVSLRYFCDLDILVRQPDVIRAMNLLAGEGYKMQERFEDPDQAEIFLSRKKDYRLVRGDGNVVVELHWRFAGKRFMFSMDADTLWGRLERISLAGTTVLNLPPDDLLLILCVHGSRHCYERLEWICDIAELIRARKDLDWARVLEQSRSIGCERMLLLGLLLAKDLLGALLPDEAMRRIESDPMVRPLAGKLCQALVDGEGKHHRGIEKYAYFIRIRERLSDRIRLSLSYCLLYLRLSIRPNWQDREFVSLPEFFSPFYYLVRPFRLASKYYRSLIEHVKGHPRERRQSD